MFLRPKTIGTSALSVHFLVPAGNNSNKDVSWREHTFLAIVLCLDIYNKELVPVLEEVNIIDDEEIVPDVVEVDVVGDGAMKNSCE